MKKTNELDSEETDDILNTVEEIFRTFDAKEWEKCRSLLEDEVEIDFLTPADHKLGKCFADDLINRWKTNLHENRKTYRQFGNRTVKIENGVASVSSKNYIFHRLEDCDEKDFWEIWGDYTHYLVKTEMGWKCSKIKLVISSQSANFDINKFLPENEIK